MQFDPTTFKPEQDGAFSIAADGKPIRLVKESDLLAVKGANESKVAEWEKERVAFNTKVEESTKAYDTLKQQLVQEQAVRQAEQEKFKDYDTHKNRVGELEKELGGHKEKATKLESEVATMLRSGLIAYGAKEDVLKDKTLDQLRSLHEAAGLLGHQAKPAKYDGGAGGGGSGGETPVERARRIIEAAESRRGKPAQVAAK